jgi:hypothetical protein
MTLSAVGNIGEIFLDRSIFSVLPHQQAMPIVAGKVRKLDIERGTVRCSYSGRLLSVRSYTKVASGLFCNVE